MMYFNRVEEMPLVGKEESIYFKGTATHIRITVKNKYSHEKVFAQLVRFHETHFIKMIDTLMERIVRKQAKYDIFPRRKENIL